MKVKEIVYKTFGVLTPSYYLRNLFFGTIVSIFFILLLIKDGIFSSILTSILIVTIVATLLYPYSIFVYESIASFFMKDNRFALDNKLIIGIKFFKVIFCWMFSLVIALLGLTYLYYANKETIPIKE